MRCLSLNSPSGVMTVLPEHGGKISSLINRSTGREWLWSNPHLHLRKPDYGESYIEHLDFGGWDDLFPSITPVDVKLGESERRMLVPDHGDLVHQEWSVEKVGDNSLSLWVGGRCASFHYKRTITVAKFGFSIEYTLANTGTDELPWLWSAHTLLAIEPGMHLRWVDELGAERGALMVPDPAQAEFLSRAEKIFSRRGSVTEVECLSPDFADCLRIRFNPEELPYLGLWLNYCGWSGSGSVPYFNLGIEPATAPTDDLCEAIRKGEHRVILPGESVGWKMDLILEGLNND